jgi:pimeloyl-ACP methyl ester carboxylesterase
MRNLVVVVYLSIVVALALLVMAFLYIDMSVHKGFCYEVFLKDSPYGEVKVDRYVTESKVVYKARSEFPFTYGYPSTSSRLILEKDSKLPIKYKLESFGVRGGKMLKALSQKGEYSDYLFLENPVFIKLEGFSTGEKTMLYSPADVMLLMALMERYNYWKKGTQFFEIMVPMDLPAPPYRTKIGVEYLEDEYIPVMGRRIEAQSFRITSRHLPEVRILMSKYSRQILVMDIPERRMEIVLVSAEEGPTKRFEWVMRNFPFVPARLKGEYLKADDDLPERQHPGTSKISDKKVNIEGYVPPKEVFFESGKHVLSGSVWIPAGAGPFVPVLILPQDGPRKTGEKLMTDYLGSFLVGAGYVAFKFDSPGQGKSQGSFHEIDDDSKVENIRAAVRYLNGLDVVRKASTVIAAHGNSAYLAVRAADLSDNVASCVLLFPEIDGSGGVFVGDIEEKHSQESVAEYLKEMIPGSTDEDFLKTASELFKRHIKSVYDPGPDLVFFMGVKMPAREYRSYLRRDTYEAISGITKPIMIISGRDDHKLDVRVLDDLAADFRVRNDQSVVDLLHKTGPYAGEIKRIDGRWEYIPEKEVFEGIKNWIEKRSLLDVQSEGVSA